MLDKIKRRLCRHDWEPEPVVAYTVEDGWLVPVRLLRCKKCGKTKRAE